MKCKKLLMLVIIILLFIMFYETKSFGATAIVNTDTLNLRKEKSTDATILEQLNKGQELDIIEQSENWVKVKAKGITGFVHKDYIEIQEDDDKSEETQNNEMVENQNNTVYENNIENTEKNEVIEQIDQNVEEEKVAKSDSYIHILPLINASKIANILKGTKVVVMDEVNGWLYVQTEEVSGWIRSNVIEERAESDNTNTLVPTSAPADTLEEPKQDTTDISSNTSETEIQEKIMYVNSPSIYIRKGPGTENEVVDSLILNSQVVVIAESGEWYKVKVSGIEGYIAKRLLSNNKTESTSRGAEERVEAQREEQIQEAQNLQTGMISKGEEIVNYAKKYLGCKYVYGGSGPSTFDCSGFTMYVYKNFGVSLSHSARAQSKNGIYVAKENLMPGDLVFFKDYETMDGIGHCGIYIGDGNFIHASSGTGYCVKISTLLSGSYYNRYETARRLI